MKCSSYITLAQSSEGKLVVKKSVFLSFSFPVESEEEAEVYIRECRKKYYDARHVCYAFVLGPEGADGRNSDNGEPSGTAGRPIQGVIRSASLTNVLVVVVRYFGGVKLGTPGLIAAYKEAAELAIQSTPQKKIEVEDVVHIHFPYHQLNSVMQYLKRQNLKIASTQIDTLSTIIIKVGIERTEGVVASLQKIPDVSAKVCCAT